MMPKLKPKFRTRTTPVYHKIGEFGSFSVLEYCLLNMKYYTPGYPDSLLA
jgi:hypothetical protein